MANELNLLPVDEPRNCVTWSEVKLEGKVASLLSCWMLAVPSAPLKITAILTVPEVGRAK